MAKQSKTNRMKDIKDYLHLYLGCEMWEEYNNEIGKFVGITPNGEVQIKHKIVWTFQPKETKLVLRPLPDITEEEKKELYYLDNHALFELGDGTGYALPYVFIWLLSKHFDLFGLIDAGIALDKTKL